LGAYTSERVARGKLGVVGRCSSANAIEEVGEVEIAIQAAASTIGVFSRMA